MNVNTEDETFEESDAEGGVDGQGAEPGSGSHNRMGGHHHWSSSEARCYDLSTTFSNGTVFREHGASSLSDFDRIFNTVTEDILEFLHVNSHNHWAPAAHLPATTPALPRYT
ncbi:unnamed protein product, partial [Cyprideis torosa]